MTNQEALERIEELLRTRKDKDPKARAAWEAITEPGPNDIWDGIYLRPAGKVVRNISDWPEGAVCGLLEHDICDNIDWVPDYWLWAPKVWQARIMQICGSPWHSGTTSNEALAAAIIAALIKTAPVPETPLQAKRRLLALPVEERREALRKQAEDLMRDKPDYGVEE